SVGSETFDATFAIVKDPRLDTPLAAHVAQFDLLQELTRSLSRLNEAVNRIRRMKRQLVALVDIAGEARAGLVERAKAATASLQAIEGVLVDIHRESPRDVLRNPAGLDDTL